MKKRILLIEDNANNRRLEKFLLEKADYEVIEALDALSGSTLAREERPAAIIIDLRLSDMNGVAAAKVLRGDESTCDIPIIFVTASVLEEGIARMKEISKSTYIMKPINTRTFAEEISRQIE